MEIIAQEINSGRQQLCKEALNWSWNLLDEEPNECCLFGDIEQLLPYGTLMADQRYSQKLKAATGVPVAPRSPCYIHSGPCEVNKRPIFSVSGLPCPDMSSAGKRRKRAGVTSNVYLCHGRWATENEVPLLLIECTKDRWRCIF